MPYSKPPVSWSTSAPSQNPGAGSDVATVSWPGVAGAKSWPAMSVLSAHARPRHRQATAPPRRPGPAPSLGGASGDIMADPTAPRRRVHGCSRGVSIGSPRPCPGRPRRHMSTITTARACTRVARSVSAVPYLPGLDGMRALAVVAVMVYHANSAWLPGGFLGVEVFFVISGYLITLLLIGEHERTGTVEPARFWVRRARRLLPALFTLLDRHHRLHRAVPARRPRAAARRRHRRPRVRVELVPDLGRPGVHRVRRLRPAAPPVEPGRRGAVLPRCGRW